MLLIIGGQLLCYVHEVTPVHNSGNVKYTTCQLQTSEHALVKAICFSPEKNRPLKSAMENKSPIKMTKYEYNKKFCNVVIKGNTTITIHAEALPFKVKESLDSGVLTIDSLKTTATQQLVTVKATVINISGVKSIKLQDKTLRKSTATLADPTGSISAVFWEEWSNCVEANKTYVFKNLRMKNDYYTKEMYANTAKEGFQLEVAPDFEEDLADAEPTLMEITTKEMLVSIIGVKSISSYYACSACGKKGETTGKVLQCQSCKMKQKVMPESKQWFIKLFVQNTTTKEKLFLTVFNRELKNICEANGKILDPHVTEDQITDILLEANDVNITYSITENKVLQVNI